MSKLKGSVAAIKMKYLLFAFATVLFVALPIRVYQLLAVVDTENGFYKSGDITVAALYIIVFFFVLLFMAMSFLSKEVPSPKLPTGKNPVLGISSIVMVVGLLWDILAIEKLVFPSAGEEFIMDSFAERLMGNISENGGILLVLQFVFAIFAIFYFIVFSVSHLNGKGSYKEFKLLALAPLCWSMTSLISKLMKAISFISVSELLFEIFMFVFVMLFFLTFARISSGVFTVDSMWGIYGYGLSACLFAGLVTIPRVVSVIASKPLVAEHPFSFAHFAILVFIFSYIAASLGVGFKDGVSTRKTITEVALPDDDEVVIKRENADTLSQTAIAFDDFDELYSNEVEEIIESEPVVEEIIEAEPVVEEIIEAEPEIEEIIEAEPVVEEIIEAEPVVEEIIESEPEVEEIIEAEPEVEEIIEAEPVVEEIIEAEPVVEEIIEAEPEVEEIIEAEPEVEEIIEAEPVTVNVLEESAFADEEVESTSEKIKKAFGLGKKAPEPEVIKPMSLADMRKNKDK